MSKAQLPVLVSLSSFGRELALEMGQAELARIVAKAGADGVEYRGELQRGELAELGEQRAVAQDQGLQVVWSSPEGIWKTDQSFDADAVERAFVTAQELGAYRVKMSLGAYVCGCDLEPLRSWIAHAGIELVIENDQTEQAGMRKPIADFFVRTEALGWSVPMTFDMGNWHWTGEDPLACANQFSVRVGYIHAKGVVQRNRRWHAVPIQESQAAWQTILARLPKGVPRAIEYPLQGADLTDITRTAVLALRSL